MELPRAENRPIIQFFTLCAVLFVTLCGTAQAQQSLTFEVEHGIMYVYGETTPQSLEDFRRVADAHPEVDILVFEVVPGSLDDYTNLQIGLEIHRRGIRTVAVSESFIASGGVDLFLAGVERAIECGAELGVHSWGDSQGRDGGDVPRSDPAHQAYLNYYKQINIPADFYWFTLKSAPAQDLHIVSDGEIEEYGMATEPRAC